MLQVDLGALWGAGLESWESLGFALDGVAVALGAIIALTVGCAVAIRIAIAIGRRRATQRGQRLLELLKAEKLDGGARHQNES